MKRRDFITRMAVAPLMIGGAWGASSVPQSLTYSQVPKRRLPLSLGASEQKLFKLLDDQSDGCHLFGAPVMSKICGGQPAWVNIIGRFDSFTRTKRSLFAFGAEPVSTPEMPTSFIKFRYAGQVYNVVDGELDSFCQSAFFSARQHRLPFAHGFLLYDPRRRELHDPCEAVATVNPTPFKLIAQPPTPVDAFDWVLSGWFESRFLGLKASGDLPALEVAALDCEEGTQQARFVVERVMNYFPEIVDHLGQDVARRVAGSKLVCQAMREGLGVDFQRAYAAFESGVSREANSGARFIAVLRNHLGTAGQSPVEDGDLYRFMAQNNFAFRRPEWLGPNGGGGAFSAGALA